MVLLADGKVKGKQSRLVQLKRLNKRRTLSPGSQERREDTVFAEKKKAQVNFRLLAPAGGI